MSPRLSVIIPAYNVAAYLADAVQSVLDQTFQDLELIVIDDGSTDATPRLLERWIGHPLVRILRQENRGIGAARNAGLEVARGALVSFLDADDRWDPRQAERLVPMLEANPDLDLVFSHTRLIDEHGGNTGRYWPTPPKELSFEALLCQNFLAIGAAVVRRAAVDNVGRFDPSLVAYADLDLWLRIALLRPCNIVFVPELLSEVRIRPGQATGNWRRMLAGWEAVLAKARAIAPTRTQPVERSADARQRRYLAYVAYVGRDHAAARRLLVEAWRTAPTSLVGDRRTWLTTIAIVATILPEDLHCGLAKLAGRALKIRHPGIT